MSLKMEEREEFETALKTVKKYETKTDMKIIKPKKYKQLEVIIRDSKRQKEGMDLSERLDRLESTVSKLVNIKEQPKEKIIETKIVEEK